MWVAIVALVIIAVAVGAYLSKQEKINQEISSGELPKFIQADFIDLDKIFSISKFRSGSGHDFSRGAGETCRSMKHYFNTQDTREKMDAFDRGNGIPPKPDGISDISIYAPVDGKIVSVETEEKFNDQQVYIQSKTNPEFIIRLFHIYLEDGLKKGGQVKAGQKIGVFGQYSNTDIAVQAGINGQFISYFDVMPDNIFAKYIARGIKTRDDMIISKTERNANPLQCNGEQFAQNYDSDQSFGNFVHLIGYQEPINGY